MNLLAARDLGHAYGSTHVFGGIDFTVAAGQRIAALGASGSGKTTLLRLLAGLETPRFGTLERIAGLRIGMVFQDLALWPNLTALQNVTLVLRSVPRSARREAGRAALERCHVAEFANRLPGMLSVGQQQRVALARAIAGQPQLLLLDEPFSSLDLVLKAELFEMVRQISAESALILVTHDPLEALALCEESLVIEAGKAVESGPLRSLLENPRSQLLRAFQRYARF